MSEQSAVEALKPCPHCGSDKIKTDYIRDGRVCGCCSCGASTRAYNPDAEVKAVQLWNTRALQAGGRPTPREGERPENPSLKAHINLVADKYRPLVNAEAGLLSALYDVDLLPEQLLHVLDVNPDAAAPNANRFMLICELWKLAHPPATPAPKASSEAEIERVARFLALKVKGHMDADAPIWINETQTERPVWAFYAQQAEELISMLASRPKPGQTEGAV